MTIRTNEHRQSPTLFPSFQPWRPGHQPPLIELPPCEPRIDSDDYRQMLKDWKTGPVVSGPIRYSITYGVDNRQMPDLFMAKLFFDGPRMHVRQIPDTAPRLYLGLD